MNISQWKIGDRTFFSLEVDDRLLLLLTLPRLSDCLLTVLLCYVQSPRLGSMEQLVSGEEKQRWEGERERLVARIKELQVAATLHLHTSAV